MISDSTGSQTNGYDGDGLRAWRQKGNSKVFFLYDGDTPVIEESPTNSFQSATTYGADGLVSRRTAGGGTVCYLFDERGNVSQRTDSTGAVTGSELYDAYGTRTGTASQPDPFGFEAQAGYYTDTETGLILCTHRFYDPGVGRWLTRDPISYWGGINLYGYSRNDPVNEEDPSGLVPPLALAGGGVLAGGTAVGEGGVAAGALFWPVAAISAAGAAGYALGTWATALGNRIADGIQGQTELPAPVLPISSDKPAFPNRALPRDQYGRSIPDSPYPHTQLGRRKGRKETYPQSREWGPDGKPGCPEADIDWTDHGRPNVPGHTVPHKHQYGPGGEHLGAEPLSPNGTEP